MKKLFFFVCLVLTCAHLASAQKLLIGSDAPSLKDVKWLTSAPAKGLPSLIDFYQPSNPSCAKFLDRLKKIAADYKGRIQVILLTRETGVEIDKLIADRGNLIIGYDPTGDAYDAYYVKYLPYSMLVNSKAELKWIGNMGNLPTTVLDGVE